jgi:hypothetical protein
LIASCELYNLEHAIEGVDSFGSWEINCAFKPFFILGKLKEYKRPVLWIDADGVFVQKPSAITAFNADLAARINDDCPDLHPSKVISSTIFVNNTPKGMNLMRHWAQESQRMLNQENRTEEFWDQIALRNILASNTDKAVISPLPLAYAKIFDHPKDLKDPTPSIIEHYQASRRYKKLINNE